MMFITISDTQGEYMGMTPYEVRLEVWIIGYILYERNKHKN
jgi:hypothetical protein